MPLFSLSSLRQRAIKTYLDQFAPDPAELNPDWSISAEELTNVRIRWPQEYQWAESTDWVDILIFGFERHLNVEFVRDIGQEINGTVTFEFIRNGKASRVAINFSDYLEVDERLLAESDLIFKMQYASDGYGSDKVVPGGYVPDGKRIYRYLNELRRRRDHREFRHDVFGRFGTAYAREIREKATKILSEQDEFGFAGGMTKVDHKTFLKEAADSRVCIDMPGLGPFCFRLVNYLAVGTCVIAYPHAARMHVPLIDRKHIVYCKEDMSDLTELCRYYVEHDAEREEIAANARAYFDRFLHKDNLTNYYLRSCLDKLS